MINIMKNISRILIKRKSFVLTSIVMPILMVLIFANMNSNFSVYKVGLINNDRGELGRALEERLSQIDVIKIIKLEDDKNYNEKLMFHEFEMLIVIDEDFTEKILKGELSEINIKSIAQTDMEPTMVRILNSEVKALATICNNIPVEDVGIEKVLHAFNEGKPNYEVKTFESSKVSIWSTLGIIFYLIFVSGSMSCSFILEDESEGTKDRILMGKISEREYYGGVCAIFFILTSIPAIEYFIICNVFNYEFGFENKIILLILLLIFVLFSVVLSITIASVVKKKPVFILISLCFTLPMFMLSGSFWPFEVMSKSMQRFGSILPPRWLFLAVEKLQAGEDVVSILPIIGTLLILIVFLFLLSVFFTRNKIVLIKDE